VCRADARILLNTARASHDRCPGRLI
jgi:hypothetical protein